METSTLLMAKGESLPMLLSLDLLLEEMPTLMRMKLGQGVTKVGHSRRPKDIHLCTPNTRGKCPTFMSQFLNSEEELDNEKSCLVQLLSLKKVELETSISSPVN